MGKTYAKRALIERELSLHRHMNVYHLDTKKRGDYSSRDGTMIYSDIAPDAFKTGGNRLVWQPVRDDERQYNRFFKNILDTGLPSIIDIDEVLSLVFGDHTPRELDIVATQGRASGISIYGGSQRVANSARELLSQVNHLIVFSLTNPYDMNAMIRQLELVDEKGKYVKSLGLAKQQIWYKDVDSGLPAIKFKNIQELMKTIKL